MALGDPFRPALPPPDFMNEIEDLRAVIPPPSERVEAKVQPRLEEGGRSWIASARLVGLATRRPDGGVSVQARARRTGVAQAPDDDRIEIWEGADARIGELGDHVAAHAFAGLLFMRPGVDSTLRANGAARLGDRGLTLDVAETYVHCPKAFVRSKLWATPAPADLGLAPECGSELGPAARRFVEHSPFALLGTCLENGSADVSPRGDPPGFVRIVDPRTLLVPDRPGNRIADSFRNLLAHPSAGLLFLVPGIAWALQVTGHARITADPAWLAPLAVKGRAPKLGIWLRVEDVSLAPAPALETAGIWEPAARGDGHRLATAGRLIVQQMEPGGRFLGAKGKLVDWMLARDAKRNLY